jgi:hypothetical protein
LKVAERAKADMVGERGRSCAGVCVQDWEDVGVLFAKKVDMDLTP